jgi:MATE family, multidrug efflux pump
MLESSTAPEAAPPIQEESAGGMRELFRFALPLILSSSFWTLQIFIDRVLVHRLGEGAAGAAMMAALIFWTPLTLIQQTAAYAATFVAQYTGAGRPHRVGPVVGQALYFALFAGVVFIVVMVPLVGPLLDLIGHPTDVRQLEADYLLPICFAALPMTVIAAANSFFLGRGSFWTVLLVDGVGCGLNIVLGFCWIYGYGGLPAWGMAGAGWALVVATSVAALLAVGLFLRRRYREEFATRDAWRFDPPLFRRLMYFGLPNGVQWAMEGLAFNVFLALLGRLGVAELDATSIAFTINLVAFLPMVGLAQAAGMLVGRYLGADRPDLAERAVRTALKLTLWFTIPLTLVYAAAPGVFTWMFPPSARDPAVAAAVEGMLPVLLRFVAAYILFDVFNLIFSFALRGAGDTRFVSLLATVVPWPVAVLPTYLLVSVSGPLEWAWVSVTAYILVLAVCFYLRFRQGKWKAMRVIEPAVIEEAAAPVPA